MVYKRRNSYAKFRPIYMTMKTLKKCGKTWKTFSDNLGRTATFPIAQVKVYLLLEQLFLRIPSIEEEMSDHSLCTICMQTNANYRLMYGTEWCLSHCYNSYVTCLSRVQFCLLLCVLCITWNWNIISNYSLFQPTNKCPSTNSKVKARRVDKISRLGFPLSFIIFNIGYWFIYVYSEQD